MCPRFSGKRYSTVLIWALGSNRHPTIYSDRDLRARSSIGQSGRLRICRLGVRVPSGAPYIPIAYAQKSAPLSNFLLPFPTFVLPLYLAADDPVSPWESQRENRIFDYAFVQNPFVHGVTPVAAGACPWE